jgi:hypothetical protein
MPTLASRATPSVKQAPRPTDPPTCKQVDFLRSLGADPIAVRMMSKSQASRYIELLIDFKRTNGEVPRARPDGDWQPAFDRSGGSDPATVPAPAKPAPAASSYHPNRCSECGAWGRRVNDGTIVIRHEKSCSEYSAASDRYSTKIPINMLQLLEDGRYAARLQDGAPWVFFRVSRPKRGNNSGSLKIQTQHGDMLRTVMVVRPNGQVYITGYKATFEDQLMAVITDRISAAIAYGREIGQCCRCGKQLTSDWKKYGIGPECDKHWPYVRQAVEDGLVA